MSVIPTKQIRLLIRFYEAKSQDIFNDCTTKVLLEEPIKALKELVERRNNCNEY